MHPHLSGSNPDFSGTTGFSIVAPRGAFVLVENPVLDETVIDPIHHLPMKHSLASNSRAFSLVEVTLALGSMGFASSPSLACCPSA